VTVKMNLSYAAFARHDTDAGRRTPVNIQLVCVRSLVVTLGHLLWIGSSGLLASGGVG